MRTRCVVQNVLCDHQPIGPILQRPDFTHQSSKYLLYFLMHSLVGTHFTRSQSHRKPLLDSQQCRKLRHEPIPKLHSAITPQESRNSPASQNTPREASTDFRVRKRLQRLQHHRMRQAAEISKRVPVAVTVLSVGPFTVHRHFLPTAISRALNRSTFYSCRTSPAFQAR